MLKDKHLHLALSYLLIHTSCISVQSAVPVDREKLHFSYLAFLLCTLIMRCQEGKGSTPEVIYWRGKKVLDYFLHIINWVEIQGPYKASLTTLYDGSKTQITSRPYAMDHEDKVIYFFWFTWKHTGLLNRIWDSISMYLYWLGHHSYPQVFLQRCCPLLS